MTECPFNAGINAMQCKECSKRCGFAPKEITRRKRAINEGLGLTKNKNGLRRLVIKRRENLVHAD